MPPLRHVVAAAAAFGLCLVATAASAAPYSSVYVFGDSLSDIGRVAALTGGFPGPSPVPALNYAPGRFSNGAVAVETLTLAVTGSPLTLAHDYAYGGARTGVSPFPNTPPSTANPTPPLSDNNSDLLTGTGLLNQTAMFRTDLGTAKADPNALYVVWAGANDFSQAQVLQNVGGTQWTRVIGNIETAIDNLAADGATHFFVPNIPNLGLTPEVLALGPVAAAGASYLTAQFDIALAQSLARFDAADPRFDIKTFDVYGYMTSFIDQVETTGSDQGIRDVVSRCQTTIGCDPARAFFWDGEHPTAAAHAILGDAFAAALVPEPATYAMLLAGLGAIGWMTRRQHRATAGRPSFA